MEVKLDSLNIDEAKLLDELLRKEIIKSESIRAKLFVIVASLLLIFFLFIVVISYKSLLTFVTSFTPYYVTIVIILIFIAREVTISKVLKRSGNQFEKLNSKRANIARYSSIFFETSIPTILIIVFSLYTKSFYLNISPIILLYFIFIALTTLSLDYRISLFAGAVSATEYLVFSSYAIKYNTLPITDPIFTNYLMYVGKAGMILVAGVAAGFVGEQLKRQIRNTFLTLLERNRVINLFDQQISKEIVEELVGNSGELESKRKFVCVMFLDIRGFTQFAENKEPEEIISYQNQVFGFMIEIITRNGGVINQFLGDGYMATFGAPISRGNDSQNAVNAALEIIATIKQKNDHEEIPFTRIGIGLHSGEVVAGNVGTSIRKQYSISGIPVVLASRIEGLTKEYKAQLLVSDKVLKEIDTTSLSIEDIGPVSVKGHETPIVIYKLA
ncbi:MAG: adenylate/guanylate cyclase domain-containing protein [Melioribacteraceae bacterium]